MRKTTGNFKTTQSNFHKHPQLYHTTLRLFLLHNTVCLSHSNAIIKLFRSPKSLLAAKCIPSALCHIFYWNLQVARNWLYRQCHGSLKCWLSSLNECSLYKGRTQQEDKDKDNGSSFHKSSTDWLRRCEPFGITNQGGLRHDKKSTIWQNVLHFNFSQAAKTGRPLIVSTGMSTMSWVSWLSVLLFVFVTKCFVQKFLCSQSPSNIKLHNRCGQYTRTWERGRTRWCWCSAPPPTPPHLLMSTWRSFYFEAITFSGIFIDWINGRMIICII